MLHWIEDRGWKTEIFQHKMNSRIMKTTNLLNQYRDRFRSKKMKVLSELHTSALPVFSFDLSLWWKKWGSSNTMKNDEYLWLIHWCLSKCLPTQSMSPGSMSEQYLEPWALLLSAVLLCVETVTRTQSGFGRAIQATILAMYQDTEVNVLLR